MRMSHGFDRFGTDVGGMEVIVETSTGHRARWTLVANEGVGPFIPTIPAIIIANKIIRGQLSRPGAYPCLNLFCLDDFEREVAGMPITTEIDDLSDS